MKVLICDDERELRALIGFALRQAGYLVIEAPDGERALELVKSEQPNLVILDINLPGMDGFEVCRRVRGLSQAPVMMLSVRAGEDDQVQGLDVGADDYLVKPFSPRTLLARVRALLRRHGSERPATLETGILLLDPDVLTVSLRGASPLTLTPLEFRLLQGLVAQEGRTISAEKLVTHVWGSRIGPDRQQLKQLVHRLRQKIEVDPAEPTLVRTVAGVGYRLVASEE
jgi:DNA-binding response OmpR family regulator